MKNQSFKQRVWVAASAAAVLIVGYIPVSQSQEAKTENNLEEVTVTGSRIVRRDLESNSPLVTIETDALERQTGLNVESYLNQLPNFNPAAAPTIQTGPGSNSDVQISAVNSVGIAAISLRGFGPNRNLVLVNGRRPTPINALMVTDINAIPSALIKRVEIITGGASAVYGADAIGGVTNFILRDDFQGMEIDLQRGATEVGDGDETRAYALLGTSVGDGRGNITMGAEYYDRREALEQGRDFYTDAWGDPTVNGDLFVYGYNGYNSGFNPPNPATRRALFGREVYAQGPGFVQGLRFNPDGTMFSLASFDPGRYTGHAVDSGEFAWQKIYDTTTADQTDSLNTLKWNNPQELVSAPQERYSLFASGTYDVTDNIKFFSRGTWSESKTRTLLLPTNASFGWEAQMPYNPATDSPFRLTDPDNPANLLDYGNPNVVAAILANPARYANTGYIAHGQAGASHPITPDLAILLNSRGRLTYCLAGSAGCGAQNAPNVPTTNPALVGNFAGYNANQQATWIMETYPRDSFNQRATNNTNTVWQVEAGLRFDLPFGDWTGEAYYSHGESSTYNIALGNNSLTRWRNLVTMADYGLNAKVSGNGNGASPGFGAADITCATGFYDMIFGGDVAPSDDCKFAVEATLQSRTQNTQDIGELNFQGELFDLPAGELRGALGLQYRQNAAQFIPDILQSTASFADQVIGVYPTAYLDASTSVNDFYAELLVPVVSGLKFAKKIELELGGRYSDYEDTDSTKTYKLMGSWDTSNWLRFRGGYNRATRAPNLGELFLNTQEIFTVGGANFGDPCGLRSNSPYGAGGAAPDPVLNSGEPQTQIAAGQTAAGARSTQLICQAQMGATGANAFYTQDATGGTGSLFNWVLQQGNPNLESEKADTFTFGFVANSPSDKPLLAGFSASVDWWKVDIDDAIQQYSIDYARHLCYGTASVENAEQAAVQAASPACQSVSRNLATGGANTMLIAYDNQATIATSGIDLGVNWLTGLSDLGFGGLPGRVGANIQATWLDYYKTKQSGAAFDVETDWKGSLGPNLTGTNAGAYSYRLISTFSYILPQVSVSLRWRHLPGVWSAAHASQQAIIENNERVAAGADGVMLSYTPLTAVKAESYNVVDLSFNWAINDRFVVRGGIDNLFDSDPVITGAGTTTTPGLTAGYEAGTDLRAVCSSEALSKGCVNPTQYSVLSSGAGITNGGYYDTLGRRYFVGAKFSF